MSATKILWGQILTVFLIVLTAIWGATQYVAWALGFQAQLGAPWFTLLGWPIYYPPTFFWWWYFYEAYAPNVFTHGGMIAASGGFVSMAVAIGMSVWRARETKKAETHGSARWAEPTEVRSAGLLDPDGVILGRYDRAYLRHDGPEHVLCFAPTRSGKGVGLVVPSLLTWPGSAIVHDIKGENRTLTAGFRAQHGRVLLFDPTNAGSSAYNPLLEVRRGEWEVRDVQNIADILVDPEGSLEKRNHWEKTSHSLLVGAILHVLYAEGDKTLAGVAAFLSDPKRPIESTLAAMMKTAHLGEAGAHPVIASAARELLNKSDNERSGVLSTAMSFLGLYRDPVVAEVTRRCDWRIADIVTARHPTTLYLVVPPSDIARTTETRGSNDGVAASASAGGQPMLTDLASLGLAPQPATPSAQQRQQAFLDAAPDKRTVSPDRVAAPASPNVLQAGAVIPVALITGIRSDLPGQITAQVTENVYDSPTGRILLVPQGTRVVGQYDNGVGFGQRRVLLVWSRLIFPNGRSIVLERQPGADAEGYAGLEDGVDHHWWDLAKAAGLSTLLSVGAQAGSSGQESDIARAIRQGASDGVSQVGRQVVGRQLDIAPTLTIRPGFPVRVMVMRDLVLEAYKG